MIAVIFAYKRAKLITRLANEIRDINYHFLNQYGFRVFDTILIVQDGLRSEEETTGKASFYATREVMASLSQERRIISCFHYSTNIGLTQHLFRILQDFSLDSQKTVFFEEDKAPTINGIEFLIQEAESLDPEVCLDTLPFHHHLNQDFKILATLATDNGNQVVGNELLLTMQELWKVKDMYHDTFEFNLSTYLSRLTSGFGFKRAFNFWSQHLSSGLYNPDRTDSLMAYSLLLNKKLKVCPLKRLSLDWSDQDIGAKNVNFLPSNRNRICKHKPQIIWNFTFCASCELEGITNRVGITAFGATKNYLKYRLRK